MTDVLAVSCGGSWSAIVASGPQSTLSGVLAGFVFTGIVVVLSTSPLPGIRATRKSRQRSYALQLLVAAFIIFALNSYFTSITAGELSCNRADAESGLSGGILGTGAILLLAGLGWLLVTYSDRTKEIQIILTYIISGVWLVIIFMLAISGMGIGQAMLTGRRQWIVDIVPWILAALMTAIVIVIASRSRKLEDNSVAKHVQRAALASLAAAIVSALLTGGASAISAPWWHRPPAWAVYLVVGLSMLVPAIALVLSVPAAIAAVTRKESRKISEGEQIRNLGDESRTRRYAPPAGEPPVNWRL
jgi:hypothetical protein